MKQKNLIELVKQHHPQLSDTQVRLYLNQAMKDFCRKTEIMRTAYQFDTTADQRFYELPTDIILVEKVHVEDYEIPRLIDTPEKQDLT
jgi:hypothetical protein